MLVSAPWHAKKGRHACTMLLDFPLSAIIHDATSLAVKRFGDGEHPEAEAGSGNGPIFSTAAATLCYWACACAYTVFLFVPIYVSRVDDFEIKASCCKIFTEHQSPSGLWKCSLRCASALTVSGCLGKGLMRLSAASTNLKPCLCTARGCQQLQEPLPRIGESWQS